MLFLKYGIYWPKFGHLASWPNGLLSKFHWCALKCVKFWKYHFLMQNISHLIFFSKLGSELAKFGPNLIFGIGFKWFHIGIARISNLVEIHQTGQNQYQNISLKFKFDPMCHFILLQWLFFNFLLTSDSLRLGAHWGRYVAPTFITYSVMTG